MKLQLQMNGDNHHFEVEGGKLSDAFKDPENEEPDEFPDDAFESDNVFDNIRKQGGLQKFIGDKGGGSSCPPTQLPARTATSPINLSISSISDDGSPEEQKSFDESSVTVTPPPAVPSPKKRKVAAKPGVKKKSLKELLENVRAVQGCTKITFPGCVKLGEKVAFCSLFTAGWRTKFFTQPGKVILCCPVQYMAM